jgi:Abortive infection C-terminus
MRDYLQEQFNDALPTITDGVPPQTGKLPHHVSLDNGEPWLRDAVDELRQMQAALGVQRAIVTAAPPSTRFAELHRSGLVDEKVINDQAKRMAAPRTAKQLSDAIGSAKELTEATLRGALTQLSEPHGKGDDLPTLMKKWRTTIGRLAPPDPAGQDALGKAHAALANLVTFLAEWRNAYGSGHGRPTYPPGLKARHARVAADAAETCIRFIVTTMDDLQLLPP